MQKLEKRLDKLKDLLNDIDFLDGRGLSNEVNIRMFCYDPKEEDKIRYFIEKLNDCKLLANIYSYDLLDMIMDICKERKITEKIIEFEKKKGQEFIYNQIKKLASSKEIAKRIGKNFQKGKDAIVLYAVGEVYPFLRISSLLESIQLIVSDIPIIVFYPGSFDGNNLKLFDKIDSDRYYRAFNII